MIQQRQQSPSKATFAPAHAGVGAPPPGDPVRVRRRYHAGPALLLALLSGCAAGDTGGDVAAAIERYPDRPITIVSWVTPGSPTDMLARAIARVGPRYFGQRIDVLNRPGGSGAVAMSYLAARPADGYTLGIMTSSGAITMAAGHIPFEPGQFTYIQRIQLDPLLYAVLASSPFQDLEGMFAYARQNPGRVSVAGFGATSIHFLAFSQLKAVAGNLDMRWVAYDGSADAAVAVLGGHVDATDNNYSVVREHVRAGTMRVLGVSQPIRELPGVRTYRDQGYDVDDVHWRGIMGPARMPDALAARIHALLQQTVEDPEFVRFMEESGNDYGLIEDPAAFQAWVLEEVRASRRALDGLGLLPREPAR